MNCRAARMFRALALISVSSATLLAQQARIAGPVDRQQRAALRGNIHPLANPRFDAGSVDPSLKLDHVMVMLKRSAAQQADLDQLLVAQMDRSSSNYHGWLTPEQFGDRFGVNPDDIAQVVTWLQSEGLAVDQISRARNWIWFSGTAGQVQAALRTDIRRFSVNGESHFANASEPSVPAAIEPVIGGIQGLDDFHLGSVRPQFNNADGQHFLAPDDFATIYNLRSLYNAGYDGSGQRIVVAGESAVDLADIQLFRSYFGLPKNDPQLVLVPGTANPGRTVAFKEADLDIEWAGAAARNANIIYVYSTDVLRLSVPYAIEQNLAPVITLSFGLCEQQIAQSTFTSTRALAQQANAQGITWLAASLDSGAAACDSAFVATAANARLGLGVSFPASLPEVMGVGGTQFDETGGNYWAASDTSTHSSALSYIPEKAWNESSAAQGLASTGGGLSKVFTRPFWQAGPGVPAGTSRAVPDVSLSGAGHDGYLIESGGLLVSVGGTSAATPVFAGILALVNQYQELNGVETRSGQGNINPNLYSLAQTTPGVFHDVVAGDNIVPCVAATTDCVNGTLGYAAGLGYDPVTGLGSVDAFNLAVNLARQWTTPAISLLNPASVIAGAGSFTLVVTGTGFDSGSVVQWMGISLPTTFVNGTQLLATVSADLSASPGSVTITIVSSGGTSAPASLTVSAPFGAVISNQRVTTTPPSGCVAPPAVTSVGISDLVFLSFSANLTANSALTREWLAPNGTVPAGGTWTIAPGFTCVVEASLSMALIPFNPIGTWQARVFDHGSLLFSVPFTVTLPGNQTTPLAHAADGSGFKTTVLLTNSGTGAAPYTLRFNDDHGNLPATRFELEAGSLTGIIPAGGSATIRTAGIGGSIVTGWAELTAPASVGGSVIYSQKIPSLTPIQEGTATIVAAGSQHFFLPFDNTAGAVTGAAITNPGASGANISVTLRYSDGTQEVLSYPQLASRNHQSFALATPFPHTAGKSGIAEFTSDMPLFIAVFRFNSTNAFTALDAIPSGGAATPVTRPLAHAADGNQFKTTVLLTNAGTAQAAYTLRFNDDNGNIPATRFELDQGSAPLTGNIPAGGSVTIRTAGLGDAIVTGWAELTAPASVGGSVIYSQKIPSLTPIQEGTATIVAAGSNHFFLPFDNTSGAITGVAVTNPGASAASNIRVAFRYSDGTSEVIPYPQLAARTHQSFALATPFPHTAGKSGVAEVTSDTALSSVVFRFNSTNAFTSLEIIPVP